MWLTMLGRGAMTIRSEEYAFNMPFYVSLVVLGEDSPCRLPFDDAYNPVPENRLKKVRLNITKGAPYSSYVYPVLLTTALCIILVIISCLIMTTKTYGKLPLEASKGRSQQDKGLTVTVTRTHGESGDHDEITQDVVDANGDPDSLQPVLEKDASGNGTEDDNRSFRTAASRTPGPQEVSINDLKERCMDALPANSTRRDRVEKGLNRLKPNLVLSDMTEILKDDTWFRRNRSRVYCYLVPLLSLFYFIPSIQFVFLVKQSENVTGSQDLCYHNFECAKPLNIFSDFNHVISNVCYVIFGLGFVLLVFLKAKKLPDVQSPKKDHRYGKGIMQQLSIFYAMGFALMSQGFFSVCYHVCPTNHR